MEVKKSTFTLIKGKFNPEEVYPLLATLYSAKIEFHNRQLLNNIELGNIKSKHEEIRIIQLENTRKALHLKMKEATSLGFEVEIKGLLEIKFIEK